MQAVSHMRLINGEIRAVGALREDELFEEAKRLEVPIDLLRYVHEHGKLPSSTSLQAAWRHRPTRRS